MRYAFFILTAIFSTATLWGQGLLTTAERSGYRSTSTYEEVIGFMETLTAQHANARMEFFAQSIEGRDVPLVIIADPMPASWEALENDERIVVYLQAISMPARWRERRPRRCWPGTFYRVIC